METQDVIRLVMEGAFPAVFLWLYLQERKQHNAAVERHMDDLRSIAGMVVAPPKVPRSSSLSTDELKAIREKANGG